ncbi:MAG: Hsp20/alpha crystallin family protein [Candidatus Hodarchaeota archaeon]
MKKANKNPFWNLDEYFNNLINEMNSRFDQMRQMFEKGFEEQSKGDSKIFRRSWGYSYQLGPDGIPQVQTWGDLPEGFQLPFGNHKALTSSTDPTIDLIEDEEGIHLVAEIPGIDKQNLDVEVTESQVRITGSQEDRSYHKEIKLPGKIKPKTTKVSLRNGILEFRAEWSERPKKSEPEYTQGHKVNID